MKGDQETEKRYEEFKRDQEEYRRWEEHMHLDGYTQRKHQLYTDAVGDPVAAAILMLAQEVARAADCLEEMADDNHEEDR